MPVTLTTFVTFVLPALLLACGPRARQHLPSPPAWLPALATAALAWLIAANPPATQGPPLLAAAFCLCAMATWTLRPSPLAGMLALPAAPLAALLAFALLPTALALTVLALAIALAVDAWPIAGADPPVNPANVVDDVGSAA